MQLSLLPVMYGVALLSCAVASPANASFNANAAPPVTPTVDPLYDLYSHSTNSLVSFPAEPTPLLVAQTRRYQSFRRVRPLRNYRPRYRSRTPYTYRSPGWRRAPGAYYRARPFYGYGLYYGGWGRGGVSIGPLDVWW